MHGSGTLLEQVGTWAAALTIDDIPASVQEKVRLQIATSMAAAGAAPWHLHSQKVLAARKRRGNSLVLATGDRIPRADAAFVNAAFAMALDFDDYMLCGHTGYSAVLAPLSWAADTDTLVRAATAANELMGRLSTACFFGPLNGQMTSYIHNAGAALAVGVARGLDAQTLTNAVALALYQPSFCLVPGFWHEGAKTVTASMPLEQGIRAVDLAIAGLEGPADLLEHDLGFLHFFSFGDFPGLFDGIGKTWFSETLCYKRFPGTSYISAGVEAALQISGGRKVEATDVDAIHIETTMLSATLDALGAKAISRSPLDANAVNFSLRLSIAAALHFGELGADQLRPEILAEAESELRALAAKMVVEHDIGQTVTMVAGSPVGPRMVANLGPWGLLRLIQHSRRMNRGEGKTAHRGRRHLWTLVKEIRRERHLPVSDLHVDTRAFRMCQSARVRITGDVGGEAFVEIPQGACGRNSVETRALVRDRIAGAYGAAAVDGFFAALQGGSVPELLAAVSG